jgi:Histidine kinase-, DNA gyrase B-, and HSP90-like ATPase
MTVGIANLHQIEATWSPWSANVLVGKDVLELLSSSMYIDPISIYREYVQNAADAIDDARNQCLLEITAPGRVDITLHEASRSVRIRDNGAGIERDAFETRLTAFGASKKRGSRARGFRGVGRLAGIGYCQELIFRSRAAGESRVNELRWDCRKIKSILRLSDFKGDLRDLIAQVVSSRNLDGRGWPEHFFDVELRGVVRYRNDKLLNPLAIEDYLGQTAPVPFSPSFRFGSQIVNELEPHTALGHVDIYVAGSKQIYRPHSNSFATTQKDADPFTEIEFVRVPAVDGSIGALGWILHHSYKGAIPAETRIRGLRMRIGNIQVGDCGLLEELFTEPRFNAWSVGEIHVLDPLVVPNGRRDHFEPNVHYFNILNHLTPVAREISHRCRTSSIRRNWIRKFELHKAAAREKVTIVRQGSTGFKHRLRLLNEVKQALLEMEKIASKEMLRAEAPRVLNPSIRRLRGTLLKNIQSRRKATAFARLPAAKKRAYEQVLSLVYECSSNQTTAKRLVDRILARLRC